MCITLTEDDLHDLFLMKYGHDERVGWSPRRRLRFRYYQPGDYYEAAIDKLVSANTSWVDVGGGRAMFPHNEKLSGRLAKRCKRLVAVDPSPNIHEHAYAHERHQSLFEQFETEERFDLATFRMVAEHVVNPDAVVAKLAQVVKPGGKVVIYTVNKLCLVPIITYLTPFSIHFKVKEMLWGGDEKDTFPVMYRMNTRRELRRMFSRHGFVERYFLYLDDLAVFSKFKCLNMCELVVWRTLKAVGLRYPENNLLGIYSLDS